MATEQDEAIPGRLPADALLAIQLEGKGIQLGKISAGTVCRYVVAFRLGLQATIESVESVKTAPAAGRRKRWVERMADLPLLGIESGCVRILLGAPSQNGLFAEAEQESFAKAMELMFHSLASAATQDDVPPAESGVALSPAAELRLLAIVARLMPPKRGPLKQLTFLRHAGEGDPPKSITLDRRSRERLEAKLNLGPVDEPHANRFSPAQRDGNHLWSGPA